MDGVRTILESLLRNGVSPVWFKIDNNPSSFLGIDEQRYIVMPSC